MIQVKSNILDLCWTHTFSVFLFNVAFPQILIKEFKYHLNPI